MPGKSDLSRLNCSLARALHAVGDWWTLLIIRDAFFGVMRFSDFQKSSGIARNILANRLQSLVEAEIFERRGTDERPLYQLTEKGQALLPALVALMQWGDAWQSGGMAPVEVTDEKGRAVEPVRVENRLGETITAATLRFQPGPGADAKTASFFAGPSAEAKDKKKRAR